MRLEVGMLFDSVRAIAASSRWQVERILPDGFVHIREVGRRRGPPPPDYMQRRRSKDNLTRLAGWPLDVIENGEVKLVHGETLARSSDYVPVLGSTDQQKGLFE